MKFRNSDKSTTITSQKSLSLSSGTGTQIVSSAALKIFISKSTWTSMPLHLTPFISLRNCKNECNKNISSPRFGLSHQDISKTIIAPDGTITSGVVFGETNIEC
jgi:hypothetical protein